MKNGNGYADLSDVIPVDEIVHEILTPGGEPTGWKITINDLSSEKAQKWVMEQRRKNLRRDRLIEQSRIGGPKYRPEEKTAAEAREDDVRWIVSRINTWTPVRIPFIDPHRPVEFSDEVAVKVFLNPKMSWAFGQILDVISNDQSFTPRSEKESGGLPSDGLTSGHLDLTE